MKKQFVILVVLSMLLNACATVVELPTYPDAKMDQRIETSSVSFFEGYSQNKELVSKDSVDKILLANPASKENIETAKTWSNLGIGSSIVSLLAILFAATTSHDETRTALAATGLATLGFAAYFGNLSKKAYDDGLQNYNKSIKSTAGVSVNYEF